MTLTTPTKTSVISTIRTALAALGTKGNPLEKLGPGKLYEAWTLATVLQNLRTHEGAKITATSSTAMRLRASHGPLDSKFTHFVCSTPFAQFTIWTDIEVRTLSSLHRGASPKVPVAGDKHELDIVAVAAAAGTTGYPAPEDLFWGMECKHTAFTKAFHRSMLGIRRELSYATGSPQPTPFRAYPRAAVQSIPSSALTAFSTDPAVTRYAPAGAEWDVDYEHLTMP
ncbi:hypothetical protein DEI89_16865 [Curtobacterium sp. MCBD17_030]|nr:hypothetical protein DEI89_16865 [Curtobacterium sp. MCBD17_030]